MATDFYGDKHWELAFSESVQSNDPNSLNQKLTNSFGTPYSWIRRESYHTALDNLSKAESKCFYRNAQSIHGWSNEEGSEQWLV